MTVPHFPKPPADTDTPELRDVIAAAIHANPYDVAPMLAIYAGGLNAAMPDVARLRLIPFLPRLKGTYGTTPHLAQARFLAWRAIRVLAPAALAALRFDVEARALARLDPDDLPEAVAVAARVHREVLALTPRQAPTHPAVFVADTARVAARAMARLPRHDIAVFPEDREILPWEECARAAACVAVHAHRAGCGEAWPLALDALDGALMIRARIC